MKSISQSLFSSSSSNISDDSSILNQNAYISKQYSKVINENNMIKNLIIKGQKEKKIQKKKNIQNLSKKQFIAKKKREKKINKKNKEVKKETLDKVRFKEDSQIQCKDCKTIIKKKNYFYHDAIIHEGNNINARQKKRALKTYIKKKIPKMIIIFSDIMKQSNKLNIDSDDYPELLHISHLIN